MIPAYLFARMWSHPARIAVIAGGVIVAASISGCASGSAQQAVPKSTQAHQTGASCPPGYHRGDAVPCAEDSSAPTSPAEKNLLPDVVGQSVFMAHVHIGSVGFNNDNVLLTYYGDTEPTDFAACREDQPVACMGLRVDDESPTGGAMVGTDQTITLAVSQMPGWQQPPSS